jgi:hypothetical protein
MDPDITVITIAPMGLPGAGVSAGEKATILGNLATLNAQKLEEHTGVDATGISAGKTFVRNPANTGWIIGLPPGLTRMEQDGVSQITSVAAINAKLGLTVTDDGSGEAGLAPTYGTTANTIAQGNHQHTAVDIQRAQFAATGVLSSGARTLATLNLTYATGLDWVMLARVVMQARNNINNGTFNVGIRIGGSPSYPEETQEYLTVGGVPNSCEVETSRPFVGGGAITVTVRAIWATGDPVDLRAGRVIVTAWPRR